MYYSSQGVLRDGYKCFALDVCYFKGHTVAAITDTKQMAFIAAILQLSEWPLLATMAYKPDLPTTICLVKKVQQVPAHHRHHSFMSFKSVCAIM